MIIYSYNKETFEFTGTFNASESPLEPGVFLIPAYSTDVEPNEVPGTEEALVFDTEQNTWSKVPDYRGITFSVVDAESSIFQKLATLGLGEELPANFINTTPPIDTYLTKWDSLTQEWVNPLDDREQYLVSLENVLYERKIRYKLESDPIKLEAEYDALIADTVPDYTQWIAAVALIKEELPLPIDPTI